MENMRKDLKKLLELKENSKLNETDYENVAKKHNTTVDEVIECLGSIEIDNIDMNQDCSCDKCGKIISL